MKNNLYQGVRNWTLKGLLSLAIFAGCKETPIDLYANLELEKCYAKRDTTVQIVSNKFVRSILKQYDVGQFPGYTEIQDHGKEGFVDTTITGFYALGKFRPASVKDISGQGKRLEDFE
jgi:hypothetical protein